MVAPEEKVVFIIGLIIPFFKVCFLTKNLKRWKHPAVPPCFLNGEPTKQRPGSLLMLQGFRDAFLYFMSFPVRRLYSVILRERVAGEVFSTWAAFRMLP